MIFSTLKIFVEMILIVMKINNILCNERYVYDLPMSVIRHRIEYINRCSADGVIEKCFDYIWLVCEEKINEMEIGDFIKRKYNEMEICSYIKRKFNEMEICSYIKRKLDEMGISSFIKRKLRALQGKKKIISDKYTLYLNGKYTKFNCGVCNVGKICLESTDGRSRTSNKCNKRDNKENPPRCYTKCTRKARIPIKHKKRYLLDYNEELPSALMFKSYPIFVRMPYWDDDLEEEKESEMLTKCKSLKCSNCENTNKFPYFTYCLMYCLIENCISQYKCDKCWVLKETAACDFAETGYQKIVDCACGCRELKASDYPPIVYRAYGIWAVKDSEHCTKNMCSTDPLYYSMVWIPANEKISEIGYFFKKLRMRAIDVKRKIRKIIWGIPESQYMYIKL
ncbi:hypothetical protein SLOPH_681 [Spraguea lophii 42_110]|uniref:Uncharacterized protein n=1 Tax=Spraguea lophii (strain 42_110) TaxID=1358809 RepID=S7WD40_SPRLO|nr:hypothetical protein SLOPH_681 [Spraguea lophii 42_110]